MAIDYCNTPIPDHVQVECGNYVKGGIPALAWLDENHSITDFSNPSQWTAAIADGKAKIAKGVRGEMPVASAVQSDNPIGGGVPQITDGIDWTLNLTDANVGSGTDAFYEALNTRNGYMVFYANNEGQIHVVEQDCNFFMAPTVPATKADNQQYEGSITWQSKPNEFPVRYDAPAGIFTN